MTIYNRNPRDPVAGFQAAHRLYGRLLADIDRRMNTDSFTATERHILIALGHRDAQTDAQLARVLGTARSHLSRSLKSLIEKTLITHRPSPKHLSQRLLALTEQGVREAIVLEQRWADELENQLGELSEGDLRAVFVTCSAVVSDLSAELPFEFRVQPLDIKARAWLLGQAASGSEDEEIAACADISAYLRQPVKDVGFAAYYFDKVIATCMLIENPDEITVRIAGFYFAPMAMTSNAAKQVLEACMRRAEQTYLRTVAVAHVEQRFVDNLYRELGFKRAREKVEVRRLGRIEEGRSYHKQSRLQRPSNE